MYKQIFSITFCSLVSFLLVVPQTGADETGNWETYRNKKYGFEITYPKNWKLSFRETTYPAITTKGFILTLQPSPEVIQNTGQELPPSIGIIGQDISSYEKGWEFAALSYFEDQSEGPIFKKPKKVNFKGSPALKGIKIIPIERGAYLHAIFFPSPNGKWLFNIVLQKFTKEEDYFNEIYNKILDSFQWHN